MNKVTRTPAMKRPTHPGALIVAGFLLTIGIGTALLALPISHRDGVAVSFGDAAFTATSATTVTGLVVTDTRTVWSPFGESVLIVLIQLGGLGIMALAGLIALAVNRRLGLRAANVVASELGVSGRGAVRPLLGRIVRFVIVAETATAALLFVRFASDDTITITRALHLSVFHAVSAFNNAGFSIIDGGLERYVGDWWINLVIAGSFTLGGIGFPVVFELRERWRSPQKWSLHTKLTLSTSALLLFAGTVMLAVSEWTNPATIGSRSTADKILASGFQSATARTAGFNTVPISELRDASLMVLILLMVVGAGSASTGGGIKTSTLAVVIRSTLAEFRGDARPSIFHRSIGDATQRHALALVVAALSTVGTATFILAMFDPAIETVDLLFESASAFGTVGISTGVTDQLDTIGRLVIIALMFIGRVGPITFGTAIFTRSRQHLFDYPQEPVIVG